MRASAGARNRYGVAENLAVMTLPRVWPSPEVVGRGPCSDWPRLLDQRVRLGDRVGQGFLRVDVVEQRRLDRFEDDVVDVCLRSEEHTSELQSLAYLVCRLLLEKK